MSSQQAIVIEQTEGFANNQIYEAAISYLATRINTNMQRPKVSKEDEMKSMPISMEAGEEMVDVYEGTEFKWQLVCRETSSGTSSNGKSRQIEVRSFELTFHKKHKEKALYSYLPFILAKAGEIEEGDKTLKLYLNERDTWYPAELHHPSTFDILAMDAELKQAVMDDLARFVKRKDYYKRIGKAWKRGYLLYRPPGTGKSSLIAAMANYLKFDTYDLELTEVGWNGALRRLLTTVANRSILVIKDMDCAIDLQQRECSEDLYGSKSEKVTLSGLLNFVDGLWSTRGEERIIVFTTNYKERLDPALLRPGRMDMHIHMSYCGVDAFRVLATNYHAIEDHVLFPEIEGLISEVEVTPAEVAEVLMRSDEADIALQELIDFLKAKRRGVDEDEDKVDNDKANEETV
ncbi:protein HYPER-SENSITIVITY-RELATED 4-like [Ananas comosus]|uniref:Protein HYPER-SENSITIVITY-RELATED 4-like n=1 Tax=Ananas comosus TaxID=4615 RepID=A0A6P5GI44_ANACO|nr:protein HYPER-SENSITIVITY-RELATED 4-like [Ananas comosus]